MTFEITTILKFAEHFKPEIETEFADQKHCDIHYTVFTPLDNQFFCFDFMGYKKRKNIYINMIVVQIISEDEYLDAINETG